MTKKLLSILIMFLLASSLSVAQDNPDCYWAGDWFATSARLVQAVVPLEGVATVGAIGREVVGIDLLVACAGTNATLTGTISGDITITIVPGIQDPYVLCEFSYEVPVSGTVVTGANDFPVFTVNANSVSPADCNGEAVTIISSLRLAPNKVDEGRYIGDVENIPIPGADSPFNYLKQAMTAIESVGGEFIVSLNFFDVTRSVSPRLLRTDSQYRRYFIQGINLTNRFTAEVDWDGAEYRDATIAFHGGEPQPMLVIESGAIYDIPVHDITQLGDLLVKLKVDVEGYGLYEYEPDTLITVVPYPTWGTDLSFIRTIDGKNVRYRASTYIPKQALEIPVVEIPSFIPFIGGSWGLSPVQITANINGTSAGGVVSEPITGTGTLFLGDQKASLQIDGDVFTQMNADGLSIVEGSSFFNIGLDQPLKFSVKEPLISLIPGVPGLYSIPALGTLLKSLSAIASVQAAIESDIPFGQGMIGITNQNEVGIVSGSVDLQTKGGLGMAFGLGSATTQIMGNLLADVSFSLAPEVAIKSCNLTFLFELFGTSYGTPISPELVQNTIPFCKQ